VSAQLICTIDGKRTHLGVFVTDRGWLPICGQAAGSTAWGRYSHLKRLGRTDRSACTRCPSVAAQISALAVSAEER
jgi:hypothetical protein